MLEDVRGCAGTRLAARCGWTTSRSGGWNCTPALQTDSRVASPISIPAASMPDVRLNVKRISTNTLVSEVASN